VSLSQSVSHCHSQCHTGCVCVTLLQSASHCHSQCHPVTASVTLAQYVSHCYSQRHTATVSVTLSQPVSHWHSMCHTVTVSVTLPQSASHCHSLCLCIHKKSLFTGVHYCPYLVAGCFALANLWLLNYRQHNKANHCRIKTKQTPSMMKFYLVDNLTFDSIYELINHYKTHKLRSQNFEMTLKEPVPKPPSHLGKE